MEEGRAWVAALDVGATQVSAGLPDFRVSELTKSTAILGPAASFFLEHGIPILDEPQRRKKV